MKATKLKTKKIKVTEQAADNSQVTKLKLWLMTNKINQNSLSKKTGLSIGTIHRVVNTGKATKSVKKLLSHELKLHINELHQLLELADDNYFKDSPAEAPDTRNS
jgi:DNA-binding transcriptional regulator LsrR (DeoR family)